MVSSRRKSRLPASIQIELIRHFVAGSSARSAAEICGINRNSAILYFHKLRELIADKLAAETPDLMAGEIEVDESYFGGVRKGKRGRGAAGKVPVFGLLKRGGKVYAVTIPNARTETLLPIIERRSSPTVSSTLTAFVPTTCWMCLTSITSGSITQRSSWRIAITLMASRTFGTRLSDICAATTASQSSTFTYTSRNVSGGSIIDLQRTS